MNQGATWRAVVLAAALAPAAAGARPLQAIAVVDQDSGTITEFASSGQGASRTVAVGRGPAAIAADPDGATLYVTYPDRKAIGVIEGDADKQTRTLAFDGEPFGIAAGRLSLYVSDWTKGTVTKIERREGKIVGRAQIGKNAGSLVLDLARDRLYVVDRDDDTAVAIDAATMRVLARSPVGHAPFALALAPDGGTLYVANVGSNDLTVLEAATLKRVATIPVGKMPYGVASTPDGRTVVASNQHSRTISIIDTATMTVTAAVEVGRYPEGVVCDESGHAFVANWFSNDVSLVDLAARREIRRIKVGEGPRGFALLRAGVP